MTNYLPYIFGLTSFLGGLYLLLLSFRIYKPKLKTEEQKVRYEKSLAKFGTLMKICSIILILNGSYDLIKRDPSRYKVGSSQEKSEWTITDRDILIKNCLRDAKQTSLKYPEITKDYCECTTEKIMTAMSKDLYIKSITKPQEEQIKEVLPLIQDCLTELKTKIESVDRQNK